MTKENTNENVEVKEETMQPEEVSKAVEFVNNESNETVKAKTARRSFLISENPIDILDEVLNILDWYFHENHTEDYSMVNKSDIAYLSNALLYAKKLIDVENSANKNEPEPVINHVELLKVMETIQNFDKITFDAVDGNTKYRITGSVHLKAATENRSTIKVDLRV